MAVEREAAGTVVTERLVLSPITADDVNELLRLHRDPLVAYWTGPWTPEGVATWAADMGRRWAVDGIGKWLAHDRFTGVLVGRGGLSRIDLDGEAVLEVGWAVRDRLTERGYATEIGRAALETAAHRFPMVPVVAFTEVHNLASRSVMRRIGLREAGTIHREGRIEGEDGLHPSAPFALYRR